MKAPSHAVYSTYRWPKAPSSDLDPRHETVNDFYKYGDVIMAYDTKAEKHDTIKIPATLADDSTCYLTEPIKFLDAKSVTCMKSVNDLCSYNSKLMLQLLNSQLFHRPSKLTETREAADVFSINVRSCKHSLLNCTQITANEDVAEEIELLGDELIDEIRMEFTINDTIISSVNVTLLSHDELVCGVEEFGPMKLIQKIEIRFKNANESREKRIRKRARGYNVEELILASRLRPLNETAPDGEMIFDYFRNDTKADEDFHMMLPESIRGKCVLNEHVNDFIRFNENSQTICTVELVRDEKSNETMCQQIQRQIIHFLFSATNLTENYTQENFASDVHVSQFWSPSYDVSSWSRVDVLNVPAWSPEMREDEKSISCLNIATSARYSFYSARVRTTRTRKYVHVIDSVTVEFGLSDELKFAIDDENQTAKVVIQVQVQFFDVRDKAMGSFARRFTVHMQFIIISSLVALWAYTLY